MEKNICPNCGRNLTESELYCYFCEFKISELKKKELKRKKRLKK
jgi:hypothetical protein